MHIIYIVTLCIVGAFTAYGVFRRISAGKKAEKAGLIAKRINFRGMLPQICLFLAYGAIQAVGAAVNRDGGSAVFHLIFIAEMAVNIWAFSVCYLTKKGAFFTSDVRRMKPRKFAVTVSGDKLRFFFEDDITINPNAKPFLSIKNTENNNELYKKYILANGGNADAKVVRNFK